MCRFPPRFTRSPSAASSLKGCAPALASTPPSPRRRGFDVNTSTVSAPARHGSRIIIVLEAAWSEIRRRHPDVPPVVVITGTGREARGGYATLGHFGAERWQHTGGRLPELFVAGELLA